MAINVLIFIIAVQVFPLIMLPRSFRAVIGKAQRKKVKCWWTLKFMNLVNRNMLLLKYFMEVDTWYASLEHEHCPFSSSSHEHEKRNLFKMMRWFCRDQCSHTAEPWVLVGVLQQLTDFPRSLNTHTEGGTSCHHSRWTYVMWCVSSLLIWVGIDKAF